MAEILTLKNLALLLMFLILSVNIFKRNFTMAWVSGVVFITYALV